MTEENEKVEKADLEAREKIMKEEIEERKKKYEEQEEELIALRLANQKKKAKACDLQ